MRKSKSYRELESRIYELEKGQDFARKACVATAVVAVAEYVAAPLLTTAVDLISKKHTTAPPPRAPQGPAPAAPHPQYNAEEDYAEEPEV